jgi:hypothetical protein
LGAVPTDCTICVLACNWVVQIRQRIDDAHHVAILQKANVEIAVRPQGNGCGLVALQSGIGCYPAAIGHKPIDWINGEPANAGKGNRKGLALLLVVGGNINGLVAVIRNLSQLTKRAAKPSAAERKLAYARVVYQDAAVDRIRVGWVRGHQVDEALCPVGFPNVAAHNHSAAGRVRGDRLSRRKTKTCALGG